MATGVGVSGEQVQRAEHAIDSTDGTAGEAREREGSGGEMEVDDGAGGSGKRRRQRGWRIQSDDDDAERGARQIGGRLAMGSGGGDAVQRSGQRRCSAEEQGQDAKRVGSAGVAQCDRDRVEDMEWDEDESAGDSAEDTGESGDASSAEDNEGGQAEVLAAGAAEASGGRWSRTCRGAAMGSGSGAWGRGRMDAQGSRGVGAHSKVRDSLRSGRKRRAGCAGVDAAESKGAAVDESQIGGGATGISGGMVCGMVRSDAEGGSGEGLAGDSCGHTEAGEGTQAQCAAGSIAAGTTDMVPGGAGQAGAMHGGFVGALGGTGLHSQLEERSKQQDEEGEGGFLQLQTVSASVQDTTAFSRDREGRQVQTDRQAGGGSHAGDGAEQKGRGAGAARWSAAVDQAAEDQVEQVEGVHGLLYAVESDGEEEGLSVAEDGSVLGAEGRWQADAAEEGVEVSRAVQLQEDGEWDDEAHRTSGSNDGGDEEDWEKQGRAEVQVSRGAGAEDAVLAGGGQGGQAVRRWCAFVHEGDGGVPCRGQMVQSADVDEEGCSMRRSVECGGEDGLGWRCGRCGEYICSVCALELGGELRQVKRLRSRRGRLTVDEMIRDSLQAQTEAEGFMEELKQHGELIEEGGGPCGNDDGDGECLGCLHTEDERADEEDGADDRRQLMSDNENEQANEKNEVDGQGPLMLADGQGPSASSVRVVDDQTTDGRGGEEGNVMSDMATDERAVNTTSYLAAVMIGGRRRAAHRGGGSETPWEQQAMRARKVEGRESQKRGKDRIDSRKPQSQTRNRRKRGRGDQATNSGGNVIVDENESSQTRFLKFRKGIG